MTAFALTLLSRHLADWMARPFVAMGNRLTARAGSGGAVGDYAIWRAFDNQYWPAHYFIDTQGRIRGHHFGEGDYAESERILRTLLTEAGAHDLAPAGVGAENGKGVQAAADDAKVLSPETYVGYERAEQFSSPSGLMPDQPTPYTAPRKLELNHWALAGTWNVDEENAVLMHAPGSIVLQFQARDLNLVLGPGRDGTGRDGKTVRIRVRLDGADPGASHGMDVDSRGNGTVREQRLYQLIGQPQSARQHTFTIEFLDAGVQAYAFTFG